MLQKSRFGMESTTDGGGEGSGGAGELSTDAMLNDWVPALADDEPADIPVEDSDGRGFPQRLQKIAPSMYVN